MSGLTVGGVAQPDFGERLRIYSGQLAFSYALSDRFLETLILPAALIRYSGEIPAPWRKVNPGARGVGDALLLGRVVAITAPVRLLVSFGLSLPTGNLGYSGDGAVSGTTFGSGTVDPVGALDAYYPFDRELGLFASLSARLPYRFTADGDQAGRVVSGSLGAGYKIVKRWVVSLSVDAAWRSRALNESATELDTGGRTLAAGPGVAFAPTPDVTLTAALRLPLRSLMFGTQLNPSVSGGIGVAIAFGSKDEEPLEPAPPGPAEASRPFQLPPPVAGKLTVYHLTASWCGPCHVLGTSLHELASADPRLAIITIDVGDVEGEPYRTLVGEAALPRLLLVTAAGARSATSAGAEELAAQVKTALRELPR